jgi:hypothetical protein
MQWLNAGFAASPEELLQSLVEKIPDHINTV